MEEDIRIIKLLMNETFSGVVNIDGKRIYKLSDRKRQALANLIKGYKELEEECKYLKEQIPVDKIFYYSYKDFIPKSKVIEKIEELKEYQDRYEKCNNLKDVAIKQEEINLLNKLLQEDNDNHIPHID